MIVVCFDGAKVRTSPPFSNRQKLRGYREKLSSAQLPSAGRPSRRREIRGEEKEFRPTISEIPYNRYCRESRNVVISPRLSKKICRKTTKTLLRHLPRLEKSFNHPYIMKRILLFFCALIVAMSTLAQHTDAMLFGHVTCKETGKHLPFASLRVKGTKVMGQCDGSGHFKMSHLPLGQQTILASSVGYKTQELVVKMEEGKGTQAYFQLEEDHLDLNQVVVTGTRTKHFVKDVPIRTEVLTAEAVKNKNALNIFEALEGVPGVRVEQQCQACNFSMVRMQGLGAEHTQVLVDGQPIYSGLAGVYGLQQMGTNDVDRLEIVKGAGSALYGSSAVAGAINVITKEPSLDPSISADTQFGNFGHKSYNANASMRRGDLGLNVFAQRLEDDAIDVTQDGNTRQEMKKKDGVSDRVLTQLNNVGFGVYFFHPFAKNDKLIIRGKAMDEFRAGGTLTDNAYLNPFTEGTENIRTNRLSADMNYTLPLGQHSELNLSSAFVHHRRNATNDTFLGSYKDAHKGQSPDLEMMRPYLAKENTFTPSLSFTSTLDHHTLLLGAQGSFTKLRESGLYCIDDDASAYFGTAYTSIGRKHANEMGLFAQDEWKITHKLTVVPGVRLDFHQSGEAYESSEKVFDGSFPKTEFKATTVNPRLAVKYDLMPSLILRANLGTGFRAPYGFSEDLHLCSGSPRVWKSSNLQGEKSMSFNLSADYYGKNFQLSANIFRTNLKNKIEFAKAEDAVKKLGYTYQWENVDDAFVQGIELGAKVNLFRYLRATLNWTFNQGEYKHVRADWANTQYADDSQKISRFPAMTGDFSLDYTPGTWTFSLNSIVQGRMFIDYMAEDAAQAKIKKTDAFALFNARVAKKLSDNFSLYAGGKNIFSYLQPERHTDDAAFMYAPVYGATWYAGVTINF